MKQVSSIMKESVWVEDKSITDCKGCSKPFSVSRRKVRGGGEKGREEWGGGDREGGEGEGGGGGGGGRERGGGGGRELFVGNVKIKIKFPH